MKKRRRLKSYVKIALCTIIIALVIIAIVSTTFLFLVFRDKPEVKNETNLRKQGDISNVTAYNSGKIQIIPAILMDCLNHTKATSASRTEGYLELKGWTELLNVDLEKALQKEYLVKSDGQYYLSSYCEYKQAPSCNKDYLIQKAKLTKKNLDAEGNKTGPDSVEYLVEAWQLSNVTKKTLAADSHDRKYVRDKEVFEKQYTVEFELGCGIIYRVIESKNWPYNATLHNIIQDYSTDKGIYDNVIFDFSVKYESNGSFNREGNYSMNVDILNISVIY